jgi:hypothetical protein
MNERIKELLEECTDRHFSECIGGFETFDKEKFAELIVRECVKVAMRSVSNDEPKEAWYLIQEHFGVE